MNIVKTAREFCELQTEIAEAENRLRYAQNALDPLRRRAAECSVKLMETVGNNIGTRAVDCGHLGVVVINYRAGVTVVQKEREID